MGTLTHLPIPCQAVSLAGRPCVERYGHVADGLSHLDAYGDEWLDAELSASYLSDPGSAA
jgi:hypothetical protein